MHQYRVLECWVGDSSFSLRCNLGRFHLARALSGMPPTGVTLQGAAPHLGFGVLECTTTGSLLRVIFVSVNTVLQPPAPYREDDMHARQGQIHNR
jgi:hypothetical protein